MNKFLNIKKRNVLIEVSILMFLSLFRFNFIGSMSLADFYILLAVPKILLKTNWRNNRILRISKLFLSYLIIQLITEIIIDNEINNILKGIGVTVLSYFTFMFYYDKAKVNVKIFIVLLIGNVISPLILSSDFGWNIFEMADFKFKIGPAIMYSLLVISIFLIDIGKKSIIVIIFVSFGLLFVFLDSRSNGTFLILTGLIFYFKPIVIRYLTFKKTISFIMITLIPIYIIYSVYIYNVLNRTIGGEHSYNQITKLENPFNPLELIMNGRGEAFVAFEAMMDRPITGHGSWAIDKTGKYRRMLAEYNIIEDERQLNLYLNSKKNGLPTHSVIFGAGAYNGIFAFIIVSLIIIFYLKEGLIALKLNCNFSAIIIFSILYIIWTSLFSPLPHLRFTLPLFFSILFYFEQHYSKNILKLRLSKNNINKILNERTKNYSRNWLQSQRRYANR